MLVGSRNLKAASSDKGNMVESIEYKNTKLSVDYCKNGETKPCLIFAFFYRTNIGGNKGRNLPNLYFKDDVKYSN